MSLHRFGGEDTGVIFKSSGAYSVSFSTPAPTLDPLPLNSRMIVTGHSIPDNIFKAPWTDLVTAMGGTPAVWAQTGPYASAAARYTDDPALPDSVLALLQAGGASYDIFLGGEGHGASHNVTGRDSVQTYTTQYFPPAPSGAYEYARLWHAAAAASGCQVIAYFNFWQDDSAELFSTAWRAAQEYEMPLWDGIIDDTNAERAPGTPPLILLPWLQVFVAVYDAIDAGTITEISMADLFVDNVHPATSIGQWIQEVTALYVLFHIDPDEVPSTFSLAGGGSQTVDSGLAAKLRLVIRATCQATTRAGLP